MRPKPAGAAAPRSAAPGELRIIGGEWRRRKLPVAAVPGLRPTPDRVRETVFNWLGQHLDGLRCLDLFAGSGALGLEAASRGAREVVAVERDPAALRQLRASVDLLGATDRVQVVAGDALHWLSTSAVQSAPEPFDVVFLDPPYALDLVPSCLERLPALLADGARVYVEDDRSLPVPAGWSLYRSDRAGRVHYGLLTCTSPASASSTPAPSTR